MAAVKFPDVEPSFPLERIRKRAIGELNQYLQEQSYGLTRVKADLQPDSFTCREFPEEAVVRF
jgi:hypothetical protein